MAKLWFQNSQGVEKEIAECATGKDVSLAIKKYLETAAPKFKSYYTRCWEENGRVMVDVGSWSEFFVWDGTIGEYFSN